ncbi:Asp23/Gls24 family envelope stress response protein [Weissella muntiaci]|uniref:Asp23/Gls24 family envelope stress response protein n=1 Tax=Weissella muntiaci TaxID=2508881 RepID=A0A6C2C3U0_9LACO|nr:Asp23/Gls24 family envelope stress response protein [Weissella muntiaci]TYC47925.1 Asp23/Gls24 family envelope stress response protein [Weissella muntiaci]
MAEETIVLNHASDIAGETRINTRVLELIAALATSEVDGVARLRESLTNWAQEALGRKVHGKGVELKQTEHGLEADVFVFISYGVSVPKVARKIQEHVTTQIAAMTELNLAMVNVHVQGMVSNKPTLSVDPNNLFGETTEQKGAEE